MLSDKTRLVAVGCASNASGGINPVQDICRWAHDAGSLVFLDAVHYAPHRLIDVPAWDCDFLACSTYKFFGPHVGVCWGRRALLEELTAYKVRPAENALPAKWMTGTQNHEGIAGALAAVNYLADLGCQLKGQDDLARREALQVAFTAIEEYETELTRQLLEGLNAIEQIKVWGISDLARLAERVPTVSITHDNLTAAQLAADLQAYLEDRPITARRPSTVERSRKWIRRHPATSGFLAVATMVVLALAGIAFSAWLTFLR
jgi:selenocysteine lyase/cysteine desulfurase